MSSDDTFPTIAAIQQAVAAHFGVTVVDLLSDRRGRREAWPRQVAMWICRAETLHSLPAIGRAFGKRDHTTVMHAIRKVDLLMFDMMFRLEVQGIVKRVKAGDRPVLRVVA